MKSELLSAGYRLVPLVNNQKRPRDQNWGENNYTLDDLGHQVGLVIEPGMLDIDLDWPEARAIFTGQEHTTLVWGRHSRVTHLVYRCDIGAPVTFRLPNVIGAPKLEGDHAYTVMELRTSSGGEAYQAMIPESSHPDGDKLEWINRHLPKKISAEAAVQEAGLYAGISVLARFYPAKGMRDDFALALTGCMVRAGWSEENVTDLMTYLCQLTGDEEIKMRASKAQRTIKRLEQGRTVAGLPKAAEIMGIPMEWMQEVAIWLGWKKRNPKGSGAAVFCSAVTADVSKQAWDALAEYRVDGDPGVYAYGEALARVDDGRMGLLDASGLKFELNRCATWLVRKEEKWSPVSAPRNVVEDMLCARRREVTVPTLKQVSIVPTFTRDGRLLSENGFDEASGIFMDLRVSVDVPREPTRPQVWAALRQLWRPVSQFPFEDRSDKVHALAMILEPYMRDMFGPTPLYFVNKPAAGTGASLFIETSLFPTLGRWPEAQTPPRSGEEMKKTLTACFADGLRCIFFDNANVLNSTEFAAAITAEVYAARILGVSQMLRVPVRAQWIGSGNNTELSGELYRRTVDIRMDAKMANPEDRDIRNFRIKDLKRWTVDHHADQVRAALILIQYWVNAGMPEGHGSKASFESWAAKMSGLFDCIGVRGFLTTPKDRRPDDPEEESARELILAMFNAKRGKVKPSGPDTDWTRPVKASAVVDLVRAGHVTIDFGWKDPARVIGDLLRRYQGRVFEFATENGRTARLSLDKSRYQGTTRWMVAAEMAGEIMEQTTRPPY